MNATNMNNGVTIIIPAFNEEADIEEAIRVVSGIAEKTAPDYEIIVIDDASTDRTAEAINRARGKCRQLRVITHKTNMGFGVGFRHAVEQASKTFITGFPADIDQSVDILADLINHRDDADIVSSYVTNISTRPAIRRFFSAVFKAMTSLIFRMNLKYYTGYFICRRELLEGIRLISQNTAVLAEAKIKLIRKGASYIELPYETRQRAHGRDKALSFANIYRTLHFFIMITRDIYFRKSPVRIRP